MTKQNILFIESDTLELKEMYTPKCLKTISAFANANGGDIVFGINDDGEIVGLLDIKETMRTLIENIEKTISPYPDYSFEECIYKNMDVLKLHVFKGDKPPYLYNGDAYERIETATLKVKQDTNG